MHDNLSKEQIELVDNYKDASRQIVESLIVTGYNFDEITAILFTSLFAVVTSNDCPDVRLKVANWFLDEVKHFNEEN